MRSCIQADRRWTRWGWKLCSVISCISLLTSCSRFDRANQAAADEIKKLSHETFAQAAEQGRCAEGCDRQEAGFAYAKKHHLTEADSCLGLGDEDFVEGCRQYGEDIHDAYTREAPDF